MSKTPMDHLDDLIKRLNGISQKMDKALSKVPKPDDSVESDHNCSVPDAINSDYTRLLENSRDILPEIKPYSADKVKKIFKELFSSILLNSQPESPENIETPPLVSDLNPLSGSPPRITKSQFRPLNPPKPWNGVYNTIDGNRFSRFMILSKRSNALCIRWETEDDEILTCDAINTFDSNSLRCCVIRAKRELGNCMGGGSFHINEFGMVLVPSTKNWAEKRYIGDFTGSLEFYNPDTDEIIQLKDDFGYKTGDLWDKPYIGGCFKLSYNDKVSVNRVWEDETTNIILPSDRTDYELIRRIRSIKGTGGCRFVVNMYGIVITKVQIGHQWKSKYVGRINYDKWFRREDYYEHTYF